MWLHFKFSENQIWIQWVDRHAFSAQSLNATFCPGHLCWLYVNSKVCNTTVSDAPHVHFRAPRRWRVKHFGVWLGLMAPIDGFKTLRSNGEGTWSVLVVLPTSSADIRPFRFQPPPHFSSEKWLISIFFLLNFIETKINCSRALRGWDVVLCGLVMWDTWA